ncbi:MAG: hypothetical protein AAF363_06705 [Bacteroidota bacterium]
MPLPYTLSFEDRKDYLYVYVEGEEDLETAREMATRTAREASKLELNRILVVENTSNSIEGFDMFEFAESLHQYGFPNNTKIAFFDLRTDQDEDNKFLETVAMNRGFQWKTCYSEKEGMKWLLDS